MATTTYGTPYVSGTDLVANWPAASLTVANSIDAAGYYVGRGINAQTASYTGVLTDAGKTVTMTNAGATTFTVPANASVAYPTGTRINILNLGAGACTPTAGAGVTISGTITALATNESASLVKTATNTWSYLAAATPAAPGLSLVTPTSVAGSGVTLSGGQVTFTAASTVSVNGCFTSTYANYLVLLHQSARSAGSGTLVRMRAAGSDTASSTYSYAELRFGRLAFIVDGSATTATSFPTGYGATGNTEYRIMNFLNAAVSGQVAFDCSTFATDGGNLGYRESGICTQATAHDGFTYYPGSGNVTGTLRVYGMRNS